MRIRMLGPFTVELGGGTLKLAGPKQRAVLSLLAMRANEAVPLDRLVDDLWGEDPPETAPKMVQQYVSQLRRLLGDAGGPDILTRGRGYELRVDPDAVDALRFEQLVEQAAREENGTRGDLAREALALWKGPPLVDLRDEPFAALQASRLEELRLRAIELAIEGDLEAGRDSDVIGRLRALVDEHPLRERLRGLLMLALYRAGRQAEALDAFQDARWTLVETLGLEPGPELRRLQEAILRQDPALERVVPDTAWASRQTADQLGAGAGRVSKRRGELRSDERELAARVIDLHTLRATRRVPARAPDACPFKGLEFFDVSDAEYYFGRERLVAEMIARLPGTSLLGVIGPSGSGKSSAVRAGLIPSLDSGVLPGSEDWTRLVLRPGERPLAALARALGSPADGRDPVAAALDSVAAHSRLLIVVDQFEEAFTACRDDAERTAFIDALVTPAVRGDARCLVVLGLRADFYGACAAHPQLARLLGENHVLVGAMRADELTRAIEGPAQQAGLTVEPELLARLVKETTWRPGALPLLSTTLLELWHARSGDRLTMASYERTGGVHGAVARLAETAYQSLSADEAGAARNLLLRLAGDSDADAYVRRQVPLSELDLGDSEAARRVLEVLTSRRLLTVGGDSVEVAHEALLREWPRLRDWLEDDAEARRLHNHITLAARDWQDSGRDPAELYRGARLAAALDFAAEHRDALNALEREFLDEARLVSERESVRARRMNRRLKALLSLAGVALAAAGVAGLVAIDQRGEAVDAALSADAQRLGAQALTEKRVDRALLLARTGVALDDTTATRGSLLAALMSNPPALLGVFPAIDDAEIYSAAVSPAGDRVAVGDAGGVLRVFELPSRRQVGAYRIGLIQFVRFSPDGRTLAVTGHQPADEPPGALLDLVDARTLERRRRVVLPPPARPAVFTVATPAFLNGGRELIVLQTPIESEPQPHILRRVDARTGALTGEPVELPAGASFGLALAGERAIVTNPVKDETVEVDTATMSVVRRHPAGGTYVAARPDGTVLALGSEDGSVRVLDVASGRTRRLPGRHGGPVASLVYTPDGATLVSSGDDGSVWIHGDVEERLSVHAGTVHALAVTPDGGSLVTAGNDGQAFLWDLGHSDRLVTPVPLEKRFHVEEDPSPRGSAVSPDGKTLAVTNSDGTVDLLDTGTLRRRARMRDGRRPLLGAAYSRDGSLLATIGDGGRVAIWDAATLKLRRRLGGLSGFGQAVAFSPDGRRVAAGDYTPRFNIWDVGTGRRTGSLRTPIMAAAFSPDGRHLAVAVVEGRAQVLDSRTGRTVTELVIPALPRSVAFSPEGRLLFVGLYNGAGQFFTTEDWRPSGAPIRAQTQRLTESHFTPDGRTLVTASADGTVALWDVAGRRPIGSPIVVEPDTYVSAPVSPDGAYLYALPTGRRGIRLALSHDVWKRHACRVAGRDLTREEWREVLPNRPYRRVCGA